eukprot:11199964-Lingulodinium_polyedra.AAC.1
MVLNPCARGASKTWSQTRGIRRTPDAGDGHAPWGARSLRPTRLGHSRTPRGNPHFGLRVALIW